jgi:hypothetical protein
MKRQRQHIAQQLHILVGFDGEKWRTKWRTKIAESDLIHPSQVHPTRL